MRYPRILEWNQLFAVEERNKDAPSFSARQRHHQPGVAPFRAGGPGIVKVEWLSKSLSVHRRLMIASVLPKILETPPTATVSRRTEASRHMPVRS